MNTFLSVTRPRFAVFFDLDGTIFDSKKIHASAWNELASRHGLQLSIPYETAFGLSTIKTAQTIFGNGLSEEQLTTFCGEKLKIYEKLLREQLEGKDGTLVVPGFRDFFDLLKRNSVIVGVVTSAIGSSARYILKKMEILQDLNVLIDGDSVTSQKPDPEPYLTAARLVGIPSNLCLGFEDSFSGIASLHNAGFRVAIVGTSFNEADARKLRYDYYVPDFKGMTLDAFRFLFFAQ